MRLKPKCSKLKYECEVEKSIDSTFSEFEDEGKKREKRRRKREKDIESAGGEQENTFRKGGA